MNNLLGICSSLIFFSAANGQALEYAVRFRNFSVESETGSAHLISFNLYQEKYDHKISTTVNITRDIRTKDVDVVVYRCSFEKSDCENFLRWKFAHNLRSIPYMKNQMWTPLYDHIIPKLNSFPKIKKNVYRSNDVSLNAPAVIKFYPDVVNNYWRFHVILNDHDNKNPLVLMFETIFMSFVKRDKTRTRVDTSTPKTEKKRDMK